MPDAMKKTLNLYLLKEIIVPFLLGLSVFTIVLLMGKLINLAEIVVAKGVPLADVLRMLMYMLPSFLLVTIPMSFLLGVLLAFGRLSSDCEITAMKAGGISLYGLLPPVAVFAAATYIMSTAITIYALPWGNTSFKALRYEILNVRVNLSLKDRVFNDEFPGIVMYVSRYDQNRHLINGVLIYDERNPDEPSTIFSRSGLIVADPIKKNIRLRLLDGGVHRNRGKSEYQLIKFDSYDLSINFNNSARNAPNINEVDMTLDELLSAIKRNGASIQAKREFQLELHRRFALPFACFVFAIIGIPLGLQNRRAGKSSGFAICIAILLLYYIFLSTAKTLGQNGLVHPATAMWLPNIVFLALGAYLFRKTAAEESIPIFNLPRRLTQIFRDKINSWSRNK
jgi:lipopolysaccharide export system permease protein